jgi:hypothetical protein
MDTIGRHLGGRAYQMIRSWLGDIGKSIRYWYYGGSSGGASAPSPMQSSGTGSPAQYHNVAPAPETLGQLIQAPLRLPTWNALRGLGTGDVVPYSRPGGLPEGVEAGRFKNVQILPHSR